MGLLIAGGSVAFGTVIVGVLIALAGWAHSLRFKPHVATAAIPAADDSVVCGECFAVIPLRNAAPTRPNRIFGSTSRSYSGGRRIGDASMVLYILCWWWRLKPGVDETM